MISRRSLLSSALSLPYLCIRAQAEIVSSDGGDQTAKVQAAITAAEESGGAVQLGAGTFEVNALNIKKDVTILGIPGATKLVAPRAGKVFSILSTGHVELHDLGLVVKGARGNILAAEGIERLIIENCDFSGGEAGLRISSCGGRVAGNRFAFHEDVGMQSIDSKGMTISENHVSDIGNCGIQVWQTEQREDGSIISGNHISRVAALGGGNGQNGNGINVYKAGNVTVTNNRIKDCAFTGIRNNSGRNSIITGNSISRCNEVALFVEFNHDGSVVADNIIDTASQGIEIVNFDVGGRLSQCTGNVCRNLNGVDPEGLPLGGGILCDADVIVANNLVDVAKHYGIRLGWGPYGRNLQASNNTLMGCSRGIEFSLAAPGPYIITNNIIAGASLGAIVGMNYREAVTPDLLIAGAKIPDGITLTGNAARS